MKLNDLQLNSIYLEEISDAEAAKINGGAIIAASNPSDGAAPIASENRFSAQLTQLQASFAEAKRQNIDIRRVAPNKGR